MVNSLRSMTGLTQETLNKHVIAVSAHLMGYMEGSICFTLKSATQTSFSFLYGDEIVVDIPTGPWMHPHLNREHKAIMRRKSLKILEHGLAEFFKELLARETLRMTHLVLPGPDAHCVYKTVEEFINLKMSYQSSAITVDQLSDVFRLLCYATSGALVILLLEASGFMEVASSKYRVMHDRIAAPKRIRRRAWAERTVWKQFFATR
jgi:hypothetical protein